MARLIDADALADNIAVLFERNKALIDEWLMYHVEDAIDEAPTIDAEPVIRCKDCKWFGIQTDWKIGRRYCACRNVDGGMVSPIKAYDFCSRAERKEE